MMKLLSKRTLLTGSLLLSALLLVVWVMKAPAHPVALIRVLDETGAPVVGAVILPEGMRTKSGPYVSGWYGWRGVPNPPVTTDREGWALVPYPKHVFEQIETGTLCLSVHHPDFVPDRPERVVATAPPGGAPWRIRVDDLLNRIRRRSLTSRPDPIVLKKGAMLVLRISNGPTHGGRLFAQVSGMVYGDTNFWIRPQPNVIVTRRLASGPRIVRAIQLDADGYPWFSDLTSFTAVPGQTNEVSVNLKRGVTVRGRLDSAASRPVIHGRVITHIWPLGCRPQDSPPQWHRWAVIGEDGSFSVDGLPEGDLEVVAMCDGFVSTNGPGQFQTRYPQKHSIGSDDLNITIGMEPTARLEVQVIDDQGRPLKDVHVTTSPNVRYGEWASVILMNDCYHSIDRLQKAPSAKISWNVEGEDFQGTSDATGLAVLPNVPATVNRLSATHPRFTLPAVGTVRDGKSRDARFTLAPGHTNRVVIQLEPTGKTPIAHY